MILEILLKNNETQTQNLRPRRKEEREGGNILEKQRDQNERNGRGRGERGKQNSYRGDEHNQDPGMEKAEPIDTQRGPTKLNRGGGTQN